MQSFDIETQENTRVAESTDVFSSAIATSQDDKSVAIGNSAG